MLDWLTDSEIQRSLGFYGGGAATAIGAIWAAWRAVKKSAPPAKPSVAADHSLASGGDTMIEGNVTISSIPRVAWALMAAGLLTIATLALFGAEKTVMTNSVSVGGNVEGSSISVDK
ncbi:hypothetical protein [Litoreibacter halocynthiae]|uniref:hypothetical protein n=1 Tax=Litoreibacter halocynthiae TaxID=1242689 RepID=UPI002492F4DE|nr:hypothetical protein [Litoreibacter halocynthiae]